MATHWSDADTDAAEDSRQYLRDLEAAARYEARAEMEYDDRPTCPSCGGHSRHASSCMVKDWEP